MISELHTHKLFWDLMNELSSCCTVFSEAFKAFIVKSWISFSEINKLFEIWVEVLADIHAADSGNRWKLCPSVHFLQGVRPILGLCLEPSEVPYSVSILLSWGTSHLGFCMALCESKVCVDHLTKQQMQNAFFSHIVKCRASCLICCCWNLSFLKHSFCFLKNTEVWELGTTVFTIPQPPRRKQILWHVVLSNDFLREKKKMRAHENRNTARYKNRIFDTQILDPMQLCNSNCLYFWLFLFPLALNLKVQFARIMYLVWETISTIEVTVS